MSVSEEQTVPLSVVYRGWGGFNRELIKVVAPLSREQLALSVAQTHWPIGMLVQHILNDRLWWFHLWLGEGSPETVAAYMHWEEEEEGKSVHSAEELVAGLEATGTMLEGALSHWTVADLGQVIEPPAALTERERAMFGPMTRQEILWHVHAHELHHGGELAAGMGAHHLKTLSGWGGAGS